MIKIDNLSIKFGNKDVFTNFSYDFNNNQIYGIAGKLGSGKTTLLKSIAGLITTYSGNITCNIKNMGFVDQNYTNFPWLTCLNNVLFPIKIERKITNNDVVNARDILSKIRLGKYINKYPSDLSNGMKQKLAISRILIFKPKIILMDEPFSLLDKYTKSEMQNLILDFHYKEKNTIIIATHNDEDINKLCDKIIKIGEI